MNALLLRCLITMTLTLSCGTASVARTAVSTYCVAIAVSAEDKEILAERFDEFARAAGLFIDSSHPMMRVYTPEDVASPVNSSVMVTLEKMGPFGSILTYMPLQNSPPAGLLDQLRQFVADSILPAYPITRCDEIKGFTPPVLYF